MLKREVAVQLMKHLVEHNWHGYSQYSRWGDGEGTCDVTIGGQVFKLEQGDRDCSSAIISAYEAAGISCGGATYTGNMRSLMTKTGNFKWHPMSSGYVAQAGDVYLNELYHTAMCLTAEPDMLMEFSISETGGIDGAEGDQTGQESHTRAYYNYPWNGILECINKESIKGDSTPVVVPTKPSKVASAMMRKQTGADNQRIWLKEDKDGYFTLINKKNDKCLDIPGAEAKNGTVLQWYDPNGSDAQKWKLIRKTKGLAEYVQIAPKLQQSMRVAVENNGLDGKDKIKLWNEQDSSKQTFWMKQADDGSYVFVHTYSLMAISS